MITNFKLNQGRFLPSNNNGVCFVACIDWCGNNLRGKALNLGYYTNKKVDTWLPYIEQQAEYSKDRKALNISNYKYLSALLNAVDKDIVVSDVTSRGLQRAIETLAVGHALIIGINFSSQGQSYGHAVAFYNSGNGVNGKLLFDPNQGQFSGDNAAPVAITVDEVLLRKVYGAYSVSMIAELSLKK